VVLALVALAGLWLFDRMGGLAARSSAVRGVAPSRKRIASAGARAAATVGGWLFAAVLLLPHATLLLISLVPPATWTSQAVPPVLDLSNYLSFARDPGRLEPVLTSLWMATVATLGAIVLGVGAARSASRRRGVTGKALETLIALPWAVPGTVFAIALATTFSVDAPWAGRFVLVGTPWILPLAYLVRSLPLTGRSAVAGLSQIDPALEEAASSLGASRWRTLRRVVLPLLAPALAAGASLAFITGLGDFVASIVLYTLDTRPISIEILSTLRVQDLGGAAVYGVLLAAVSAAAFLLWGEEGRAS
jgi:iron(III) transport system permease protein